MEVLKNLTRGIQDLFFPPVCLSCKRPLMAAEQLLCLDCLLKLPQTNFHQLADNPVLEKFKGRIPVRKASSFLYFSQQSQTQNLIHQLKYKGKTQIGFFLGKQFALSLSENGWLKDIDLLLPVPLHPQKKRKRGYNQSVFIADGLNWENKFDLISESVFSKTKNTTSQTLKGNLERLNNVKNAFKLKQSEFISGKHILLVDDVLTTGATVESCILEILKGNPASISIATLAFATDI